MSILSTALESSQVELICYQKKQGFHPLYQGLISDIWMEIQTKILLINNHNYYLLVLAT